MENLENNLEHLARCMGGEGSYSEGFHFEVDQLYSIKFHLIVDVIHSSYIGSNLRKTGIVLVGGSSLGPPSSVHMQHNEKYTAIAEHKQNLQHNSFHSTYTIYIKVQAVSTSSSFIGCTIYCICCQTDERIICSELSVKVGSRKQKVADDNLHSHVCLSFTKSGS